MKKTSIWLLVVVFLMILNSGCQTYKLTSIPYQIPKKDKTIVIDMTRAIAQGDFPPLFETIRLDGRKVYSTKGMVYEFIREGDRILLWSKSASIGRIVVPIEASMGNHVVGVTFYDGSIYKRTMYLQDVPVKEQKTTVLKIDAPHVLGSSLPRLIDAYIIDNETDSEQPLEISGEVRRGG